VSRLQIVNTWSGSVGKEMLNQYFPLLKTVPLDIHLGANKQFQHVWIITPYMWNMYNTRDVKMSNTQHVQHSTVFTYKSHDVPDLQQLQHYNTKMENMYNTPE